MDKKEEKTFADLFSSSATETENKDQTFSNILKSENTDTEKSKENKITFDQIFEHIDNQKKRKEDSNLIKETKQDEVLSKSNEVSQNINSQIKNENKTTSKFNPFPITSEKELEEEPKKVILEGSNPFFINTSSLPKEEKTSTTEKDEKKLKEEQENHNNPFFSGISIPEPDQSKIENNPFLESKKEEKENSNNTNNPFFENTLDITVPAKESEEKVKLDLDKEEINPFFTNEKTNNNIPEIELPTLKKVEESSQTEPENNPFFKTTETIDESQSLNATKIEADNSIEDNKIVLPQEEVSDIPKSTSPFFQEDSTKLEENPLFQGQINLIENKNPDTPKTNIDITKSKHYDVKIVKKKEPLIKFILGVISYAIFIFLLLIGITLLIYVLDIKIRAAKGDYSSPTFNAYVVLTGSMLPEIQVYDVVVTKKVEPSKLNEKDIITFASADSRFLGTIITHRILKKNYDADTKSYTFQTKGDNNNVADSALVPENNIYGKVILKIPKLGYLQEFLASDGGWIIVILIPCLTVISYDIVKLVKGLKRKKYKNIKVQK